MLGHHQLKAIQKLITDLIPASNIRYLTRNIRDIANFKGKMFKISTGESVGINEINNKFEFWIQNNTNILDTFEIERIQIPFTKAERRIIYALPEVCRSISIDDDNNAVFTQKSISSQFVTPLILVSHFMRGTNPSCVWSSIIGLVLLQKLSYKKYEGTPCSSGFLCLKNISSTIQQRINLQTIYKFEPFSIPIPLNLSFFEKPLSYRYVDGRNSFYVIDNHELVHGILRSINPKQFDIISRSTFQHTDVLTSIPGFRWLAYSGFHNDIIVRTKKQMTFQWDQDTWKMRELSLLKDTIMTNGIDKVFVSDLVDVLFTLSELRVGALILIVKGDKMPSIIGKIDTTELGLELCKTIY